MNFFFPIKFKNLKSELIVPKFKNRKPKSHNVHLYKAYIDHEFWKIKKIKCLENKDFFFLKNNILQKNCIYFLDYDNEFHAKNKKIFELKNFNDFTDTAPAFRSNLKVYITNGGVASYQSEYPFEMIKRKGNILSPISSLCQSNADINYIIFKNIFYKAIVEKFCCYLIDFKKRKILQEFKLFSNSTNIIKIKKNFIYKDVYFFSDSFLGIPIYINKKKNHLSMEHTHPPHEYILSSDRFLKIKNLKNKFNEIIKENKK